MFRLEQKEYAKEKIDWSVIDYQDNQPVIDLIASKPAGVLHILDDECNFPQVSTEIDWSVIDYQDIKLVIDLIDSKLADLLHILDDKNNFLK